MNNYTWAHQILKDIQWTTYLKLSNKQYITYENLTIENYVSSVLHTFSKNLSFYILCIYTS